MCLVIERTSARHKRQPRCAVPGEHLADGEIGVGDAVVRPRSGTGRCLVTSQDPDTGVPDRDMLAHLRAFRPDDLGEPLPFGVHGPVAEPGMVRLGDPVELLP